MMNKWKIFIASGLVFLLFAQLAYMPAVHAEQGEGDLTIIIKYGDPGYTETGDWKSSGLLGYDGTGSRYGYSNGATAQWTPNLTAGLYRVSIYKIVNADADSNAKVEVVHADGIASSALNQTVGSSGWQEIGEFRFADGTEGYVKYTRQSTAAAVMGRTDAVKFERLATDDVLETITIDNGDTGYSESGSWSDSSLIGYNNSTTRFTGNVGAYVQWTPNIATAGTYRVSLFKPVHANSDPDAKIDIADAFGTTSISLDYTSEPSGWVSLGEYYFDIGGGAGYVRNTLVTPGASARADAVKFERVDHPPSVLLHAPIELDEVGIASSFELHFSKYMDIETLIEQNFVLTQVDDDSNIELAIEVVNSGRKVILQPDEPMSHDTSYLLSIQPGVKDLDGKSVTGNAVWSFHTELPDLTPPTAVISVPLTNGLALVSSGIDISFSEPMNPATMTSLNIVLEDSEGNPVSYSGTATPDNQSYRLQPTTHLEYDDHYKLTLHNGLTDKAGNPLSGVTFNFATAPVSNTVKTLYVSPNGDDGNPGTLAEPFATINRARQAVRNLNGNMQGDITVYVEDGVYPITETLQWETEDSGSNGYSIRFQAAEGAAPVISGGVKLTGWQQAENGPLWKTNAGDKQFRQLYVNGQRATRAQSSDTYDALRLNDAGNGFIVSDTVIGDWENADAIEFVWNKSWRHHRLIVDTISAGSQQGEWNVAFKQPYFDWARTSGYLAFGPNELAFKIENALELLDTPGEWYLDQTTGDVYYYPLPEENMTTAEVIAPQLDTLLEIRGTLEQPVHHVAFHGLTFQHGSWLRPSEQGLSTIQGDIIANGTNQTGGNHQGEKVIGSVLVHAGEHIRFERNRWAHMGAAGLVLENGASDIQIVGNIFTDISASGIIIGDMKDAYPEDPRQVTSTNTIENNVIYDIGTEYWNSVGIFALYVDNVSIVHNELYDFPYSGISLGWGWGAHQESGILKNNRVEGNHIHHGMYGLNDGGAVYLLGKQPGTVIARNLVHDNHNTYGGIYLDTGSIGMTVTENITYKVPSGLINWNMFKYNITDPALDPDNTFVNNYFGFPPTKAGYPEVIAGQAGLESAYRDLLAGLPDPKVPSVTTPDEDAESTVIIANGQPGYSEEGTWATSSMLGYDGQSLTRYSVSLEASATFRPQLWPGVYRVYLYKLVHPTSDPNAKIEISGAEGTAELSVNQTVGDTGWLDLGEHAFNEGTDGYVRLTRMTAPEDNSFGYVRVSAVKFVKVSDLEEPEQPEEPGETGGGSPPAGSGTQSPPPSSGNNDGNSDNGESSVTDPESGSALEHEQICANLSDACGGWAEQYLVRLIKAGLLKGFPDGTVKPDKEMSRAEIVTILVRALNLAPVKDSKFTDIGKHWSRVSIATAAAHGIINGVTATQFHPDGILTREQLAVIAVRAFQLDLYAGSSDNEPPVDIQDRDDVSAWARHAIDTLYRIGIFTGYPDGTFRPKQGVSRGEIASILSKLMDLVNRGSKES